GKHSLHIEHAGGEERNAQFDFKLRSASCCGVWDDLDQRVIAVGNGNAHHENRANLGREAQIGEPDFTALRAAHRVVPPGPSGQRLPPPLKPGPPPSRCRRYRRREYRSCAPEIVAAAPPPLPGDPCLLGWPKPPGFHSPCSSAKSNLRAKSRQARPFAGHEGILDFRLG